MVFQGRKDGKRLARGSGWPSVSVCRSAKASAIAYRSALLENSVKLYLLRFWIDPRSSVYSMGPYERPAVGRAVDRKSEPTALYATPFPLYGLVGLFPSLERLLDGCEEFFCGPMILECYRACPVTVSGGSLVLLPESVNSDMACALGLYWNYAGPNSAGFHRTGVFLRMLPGDGVSRVSVVAMVCGSTWDSDAPCLKRRGSPGVHYDMTPGAGRGISRCWYSVGHPEYPHRCAFTTASCDVFGCPSACGPLSVVGGMPARLD